MNAKGLGNFAQFVCRSAVVLDVAQKWRGEPTPFREFSKRQLPLLSEKANRLA